MDLSAPVHCCPDHGDGSQHYAEVKEKANVARQQNDDGSHWHTGECSSIHISCGIEDSRAKCYSYQKEHDSGHDADYYALDGIAYSRTRFVSPPFFSIPNSLRRSYSLLSR